MVRTPKHMEETPSLRPAKLLYLIDDRLPRPNTYHLTMIFKIPEKFKRHFNPRISISNT